MDLINGSIMIINFMAFTYELNETDSLSNSTLWKHSDIVWKSNYLLKISYDAFRLIRMSIISLEISGRSNDVQLFNILLFVIN